MCSIVPADGLNYHWHGIPFRLVPVHVAAPGLLLVPLSILSVFMMTTFIRLTLAAVLTISLSCPVRAADPLVFNATSPTNDLEGSLAAQVLFAQSQIIPSRPRKDDVQPYLISNRKALLIVRPVKTDNTTSMSVIVRSAQGKELGPVELQPPKLLPKTAYHLDSAPDGPIDFTPSRGTTGAIQGQSTLEKLADEKAALLLGELRRHAVVEIKTADGSWVRDIYLPDVKGLEGKIVRVGSQAGYGSTVYYSGRQVSVSRGQVREFKHVKGQWLHATDLENNGIVYASDAWSTVIPAEWIMPGLSLEIRQGEQSGKLSKLRVGAPTQLLIHTIDVGMLAPPRGEFAFANDFAAHREYFQTAPTSRFIVSQYAPLWLKEVMMPDGKLLTDSDPGEGGWHNGSMRQSIGKELISHGIDNANYGINSQPGVGEDSHPYVAAQLAAHNNRGKYSNGVQVHGGSGGGGIVTLDHSIGNEFSHEVGHNYGLGHYVDGFKGSVHRSADQVNSTWGWDADKNRFIPNFASTRSNRDTCLDGQCQAPFDGRSFGMDAMAGGEPLSGLNRFTLYTPNTAAIIQRFLESKAVFDSQSPTGFSRWNAGMSRMEPYKHRVNVRSETSAPIKELSEAKLAELLSEYDRVTIAMGDGNWKAEIPLPPASKANRAHVVSIDNGASYASDLSINGQKVKVTRGFKKSYRSDGSRWREVEGEDRGVERKPKLFGVPVVTLLGYYDPKQELRSFIYPPLHGACGFCYDDDSEVVNETDCYLLVETRDGVLKFKLAARRLSDGVMNKFHVNVPESAEPRKVSVVCRGKVLDEKAITPVSEKLVMTINGIPLDRSATSATAPGK
ncbi:MAG: M66 family metalloprotease [Pirellulales bacterium]